MCSPVGIVGSTGEPDSGWPSAVTLFGLNPRIGSTGSHDHHTNPHQGEENWWIQSNQARFCLIMAEDFVTVWSLFIILFFIFHHILLIYKFPYSIFWLIDAVDESKFTKASEHRGFTSSVEGGSSRLDGGVMDLSEDILMIYDIWRWWRGLMKRIDDEYMLLLCRHLSSSSRVNIYLFIYIYILYTSVCVFVCLCQDQC